MSADESAAPADMQAYRAVVAVIASWLRHGHRLDIPSAPVGLEEFRRSAALAAARPRASR